MASCNSCGLPLSNPFDLSGASSDTCQCNTGGLVTQAEATGTLGCCVVSVNGKTGIVVLNINDIDLLGNQFFTSALAQAAIAAVSPILYSAGTISHANSGATPGTYGSASMIPQVTVDNKGHITGITQVALGSISIGPDLTAIEALNGTGYLIRTGVNTWALKSLNGTAGRVALTFPDGVSGATVIDLVTTGVSAGTYGSGGMVPQFTVDAYGRITAATNVPIPAPVTPPHTHSLGDLSNVAASADTPTTNYYLKWNGSTWVPSPGGNITYQLGVLTPTTGWLVNTGDSDGLIDTDLPINNLIKLIDGSNVGHVQMNTVVYVDSLGSIVSSAFVAGSSGSPGYYWDLFVGNISSDFRPIHNLIVPIAGSFTGNRYWNSGHTLQFVGKQCLYNVSCTIKVNGDVYVSFQLDTFNHGLVDSAGSFRPYIFPLVFSWLNKV